MHVDWTVNVGDLLKVGGFVGSMTYLLFKFHMRLVIVENWMEREGIRADNAIHVLGTVGESLARVTTLYESLEGRVDRIDDRLLTHERIQD